MKDFRELKVWQKAHELTLAVYRVSAAFPRDEQYGLTSQIRRACSSIPVDFHSAACSFGNREISFEHGSPDSPVPFRNPSSAKPRIVLALYEIDIFFYAWRLGHNCP